MMLNDNIPEKPKKRDFEKVKFNISQLKIQHVREERCREYTRMMVLH